MHERASGVQRSAHASRASDDARRLPAVLPRQDGHPLDAATRAWTAPWFGHDFSRVQVHKDPTHDGEREADNIASRVAGGFTDRTPPSAFSDGSPRHFEADESSEASPDVQQQIESERGSGTPLPGELRHTMERSLGADFSRVRIHTDPDADRLSRSLSARAFTTGQDVFFREREFGNSGSGLQLLSHELVHVIQQQGTRGAIQRQPDSSTPGGGGTAAPPTRVVYIDANVIIQINRGNQAVAQALLQLRASGADVRISPFQYRELVTQPIVPRTATAQRLMLEEMNIRVGAQPNLAQRVDVGMAGMTSQGSNVMQLRDQQLVASARADGRAVEIWSLDTPFTSNAKQVEQTYRVRVAPESQLPIATGGRDYRVGRQLLGLQPVDISLNGAVNRRSPPGGGGGGSSTPPVGGAPPASPPLPASGRSMGTRAVAGGLGLIVVLNEVLGGINRVRGVQQQNIDMGEARLAFWARFGAKPVRGVWDQTGQKALSPDTVPETSLLGSPSFPYVVDIDVTAFRDALPNTLDSYQDLLYFLDAARQLGVIQVEPPMPDYPTREERGQPRRYYAWVNQPDRAGRRRYDITDVIVQVQDVLLVELAEGMREKVGALSPAQRTTIHRLKRGPETQIFRSAGGGQPIKTAQQIFGPDPWVRTTGRQEDVGGWFSTDIRRLVVPANADAERAALVSGYWVKQPIEDTYDEAVGGNRPILDRQPKEGPINSFVAGPEPGPGSRFGQTRYYRHPDANVRWTIAIGQLHRFWVKAEDLEPVPPAEVEAFLVAH